MYAVGHPFFHILEYQMSWWRKDSDQDSDERLHPRYEQPTVTFSIK
jgi:hypothetical protein